MTSSVSCLCSNQTHYQVFGDAFRLRNSAPIPGPVQAFLSETLGNQLIVTQQKTLVNFRYRGKLYSAIGNLLDEWNTTSTTFCRVDNYVVIDASNLDVPFARPAVIPEEEDSWDVLVSLCHDCLGVLQIPPTAVWTENQKHTLELVTWDSIQKRYRFAHSEKCVNCFAALNHYSHCSQCEQCLQQYLHPKFTLPIFV